MSTLIKGSPHVTSTHPTTGETDQVPQYSPRRLAVYASRPSSPMIAQHSLPGGRYPLPVPPAGSRQLRLAHADTLSDIKGFIYADATEVGLGDGREAHRCSSLRPQDDVAPSFIQTEGCLPLPTLKRAVKCQSCRPDQRGRCVDQ